MQVALSTPDSPSGLNLAGKQRVLASAAPTGGLQKIELYLDSSPTAILSVPFSPATYVWDTTQVADGTHILKATAFYKTRKSTAQITVSVNNATPVAPPPTSGGGSALAARYKITDTFSPGRYIYANTPSDINDAIASAQSGDVVSVGAGVYSGYFLFNSKVPVRWKIDAGASFVGGPVGSGVYAAMDIQGYGQIFECPNGHYEVSNPNWDGIRVNYGAKDSVIGGFKTHNNGIQGLLIQHDVVNCHFDSFECYANGTAGANNQSGALGNYYLAGTHGFYVSDDVHYNTFMNFYVHDQSNGYGIEVYQGNLAGDHNLLVCGTIVRVNGAGDGAGADRAGLSIYAYDGGTNMSVVMVVMRDARYAGLGMHSTSGIARGNVMYNVNQDTYADDGTVLDVQDSYHVDPLLDANDRPTSLSTLKNLGSTYAATYLPRNDFDGKLRVTSDPGAFIVPA